MPLKGEASSALGHVEILRDPEVRDFLEQCRYYEDTTGHEDSILQRVQDVTSQIDHPVEGAILGYDGSNYEAAIRNEFPSVRAGLIKLSQIMISIDDYRKLDINAGFVDPIAAAKLSRQSDAFNIPLPGAGLRIGSMSNRSTFRHAIFNSFKQKRFEINGETLLDTFVDLIHRLGRVEFSNGQEVVVLRPDRFTCPITAEVLPSQIEIPISTGYIDAPHIPNEKIYLTDVIRLSEAFVEEGTNQQCYTRAMSAIEHMSFAHTLRCLHKYIPSALKNLIVVMDGPLALFGQPAAFHRAIMDLLHEIRLPWKDTNGGPLVMGITKTGKVVEHGYLIRHLLNDFSKDGMLLLPIDDEYRYKFIEPGAKKATNNFGSETYYGQDFLLRTRRGKLFNICIAYPYSNKDGNFQNLKMDQSAYGDCIQKAISLIDMMETDLYEDATIVTHLAHKYASIAHRPAGKTLDVFVRNIVKSAPK